MKAIEFNAESHKGAIKIPETYRDWYEKKPLRVILLTIDEDKAIKSDKSRNIRMFFNKINIDLNNYRFNRDESNER